MRYTLQWFSILQVKWQRSLHPLHRKGTYTDTHVHTLANNTRKIVMYVHRNHTVHHSFRALGYIGKGTVTSVYLQGGGEDQLYCLSSLLFSEFIGPHVWAYKIIQLMRNRMFSYLSKLFEIHFKRQPMRWKVYLLLNIVTPTQQNMKDMKAQNIKGNKKSASVMTQLNLITTSNTSITQHLFNRIIYSYQFLDEGQ